MRSFALAGYRLDVLRHTRVMGEDFPRPLPGWVSDWFEIDVFTAAGDPIDLYPNDDPHPHPLDPNRLTIGWAGQLAIPLPGGGVKRGADFRSGFWRNAIRRIALAELAAELGVRIGGVTEDHIDASSHRNALRGDFVVPAVLAGPLDTEIERLTGEPPRLGRTIPRGTQVSIDTDYDAQTDGTTLTTNGTGVQLSGSTAALRPVFRFPLALLPAGATVTNSQLTVNITTENIESSDQANINAYNSTGDDDPAADNAATTNTRCAGTTLVSVTTPYQSTGIKTVDLGTTADGQIQGNIDAPDIWSIGMTSTNFAAAEAITIEALEAAGTDHAKLVVDYTLPFTPAFDAFRFYHNGPEDTTLPFAAQDTNINLGCNADRILHLRVRLQESAGVAGAATDDWQLQVSKNSGAFADVAAASSNVQAATTSELTDGSATTNRATNGIADGSGSFLAGIQEEGDGQIANFQLTASNYTEHLFAIKVVSADVANGDTLDFRIALNGGTPGFTNSVTPRITVVKTSGETVYSTAVLNDDPVAYYRLGEPSGVNANDETVNNLDLTYTNTPTLGATGIPSQTDTAVAFNGTDELAERTTPQMIVAENWSLEAWVKSANLNQAGAIVSVGSDSRGQSFLQAKVDGTGNPGSRLLALRNGLGWLDSTYDFVDTTTFHHVVVTCAANITKVYVDNSLVFTSGASAYNPSWSNHHASVGAQYQNDNIGKFRFFQGTIDEVAIYDYVLPASRVTVHYNLGSSGAGLKKIFNETVQISEAIRKVALWLRIRSETTQISETLIRRSALLRVMLETVNIVEQRVAFRGLLRQVGDTVNLSETRSFLKAITKTLGELVNLGDTSLKAAAFVRRISESVNLTELITRPLGLIRRLSESELINEVRRPVLSLVRAMSETVQMSEVRSAFRGLLRSVTDSISISEARLAFRGLLRLLVDSANISETLTRSQALVRRFSESVQLTETLRRALALTRLISESEQISEARRSAGALVRFMIDFISISESRTEFRGLLRALSDSIYLTEGRLVFRGLLRFASDSIQLSETRRLLRSLTRSLLDVTQISETRKAVISLRRVVNEALHTSEGLLHASTMVRFLMETIPVTEIKIKALSMRRSLGETVQVTELSRAARSLVRLIGEAIHLTESLVTKVSSHLAQAFLVILSEAVRVSEYSFVALTPTLKKLTALVRRSIKSSQVAGRKFTSTVRRIMS